MNDSQARMVIAELQASFPRFPIPDSTVTVWAGDLAAYGFEDARRAVVALRRTWPDEHWPGLQAILGKIREVRQQTVSPALPSPPVDPAEARRARERLSELLEGFFEGREDDRIRASIATGTATPEQRDRMARAKAQRMLDATVEIVEAPTYPAGKLPSPCPIGARAEVRGGLLVCPHCGEPVRDGDGAPVRAGATAGV